MDSPASNTTEPKLTSFTAPDGQRLAARVWERRESRGRVVFLHGIVSHGGWYLTSASHLAEAGHEVHLLERRGSGLNDAERGDVMGWRVWLADVEHYLSSFGDRQPTVLCGISWGGKLAAAVARARPDLVAGLVLICPGLFAWQQPGWFKRCVLQLARVRALAGRRVTIPLTDPTLFTESSTWQEFLRHDSTTLRKVTFRFAREDLRLNAYVREAAPLIHVPTLLMLAGRDRIVNNVATREFFHRLATSEKQKIEYPNAAHTLEFEDDPTEYFRDLTSWIDRRLEFACKQEQT